MLSFARNGSSILRSFIDGELLSPGERLYVREIGVSPPKFFCAGKSSGREGMANA